MIARSSLAGWCDSYLELPKKKISPKKKTSVKKDIPLKKKKIWSSVSKSLKADAEGSLVWEGEGGGTVQTKKGKCVVESLKDVPVK